MTEPDVWKMAVIHRILRREFREIPELLRDVAPDDDPRRAAILRYLDFALDGLHAHHTTEDELVWPLLHQRAPMDDALVERMEEDHRAIAAHDGRVRAAADTWRTSPSAGNASALADAITRMGAALERHLDAEEAEVVPLIAAHLSKAEWDEVGKVAFKKFRPSDIPMATGQLLEVASPEEARVFLSEIPPPARVMWALLLRRLYARRMRQARAA